MSRREGSVERVWALMNEIKVAMVVTHDRDGDRLRARPMAARPARDENAVYFLTDASAGKVDEVDRNDNVCLAFADVSGQKYLSVTGEGLLLDDREKITRCWSIADEAFWADPNDPSIRVLRVAPEMAEYWESPGIVVSVVKMLVARLTGERLTLHENEKVPLPEK